MRVFALFCLFVPALWVYPQGIFEDASTGITLFHTQVELPAEGDWYLSDASTHTADTGYGYIEAPESHYEQAFGERTQALLERRQLSLRRSEIWSLSYRLRDKELNPEQTTPALPLEYPWHAEQRRLIEGGVLAVIPGVALQTDLPKEKRDESQILVVELQPDVNDGKHYVLRNSWGGLQREEIDAVQMAELGLEIRPKTKTVKSETVPYRVNVRLLNPELKNLKLRVVNDFLGEEKELELPVEGRSNDRELFEEWAEYRAYSWWSEESRLSRIWDRQVEGLYGLTDYDGGFFEPDDRNRQASLMNVLGGDAAIRETLQMQNLVPDPAQSSEDLLPLSEVKGVTVKAHDYEELLDGAAGGQLELANFCPPDRLFAWFPKPEGILQLLDGSGNVLGRFGASRSKLILDQQILERHLARLGLNEQQLRMLLNSGMVGESAVLLPDLFLAEGTDVTTLTRITNLSTLQPVLKTMGLNPGEGVGSFPRPGGGEAFVSISGDLLIFSSSRSELERVRDVAAGTLPSLGESAEFRYMLTQNGPGADTAAYVYLSDPFIRRLTGPALKIAQMRRLQAKARLETLAAGNLLHRMDRREAAPDLKTLIERGYVPARYAPAHLSWDGSMARDPEWGSAAELHTLSDRLPEKVTQREKQAYDRYRQNYERFWRQFFDPIAVRVDLRENEEVETTIFILPLINSSIYDTVRGFFRSEKAGPPPERPVISPAPVAMLSMNLSEVVWVDFLQGVSQAMNYGMGLNLPIWEQIGPGMHFGLADSDAIITFGSGELLDLLGTGGNFRDEEMLAIPMIGSLLTRPVVVALELQDPDAARRALRGMLTGTLMEEDGFLDLSVNVVKITGEDRWLIRLQLGGMLYLTLSMEVQDKWLVFSNLPLTYAPKVTGNQDLPIRDASLLLQPGAIDKTGPGFEAAALDNAREQAMAGLSLLYAYHMIGIDSLEEAMNTSRRLFGYVPVHPSPGEFIWTERGPESSVFGSPWITQQPPLSEVDSSGLLPRTEQVEVSMQLENEGLRTRLLWKGAKE